ncbi:MAG: PD40 domain-containing protein [Planctomycetes bacterium]|nr:PD40 domain-containing protein [Planctomycetota bacterium]
MTANPTPKEKWSESEETFLTNVRQLTLADMGLTKSGEAYFSPDLKRVIFQAFPAGEHEYQMYTIELDEAGNALRDSLHRISPPGGACTCGNFRPDGEKLIYASSYLNPNVPNPNKYHREGSTYKWDMPGGMDVIEANIDGSEPKQLTQQLGYDAECAYSPDGKQIVFSSDRDGDPDLYIMSADGTDVRQLTNKPGYDGGPFFSPDGKKVIFRADRKQDDHLQIFVINTDGTGEKQLTSHSDVVNWAPYWLPDGRSIVFATSVHGHYNYEVYYLDIRTGRFHRITYSPGFDGLPVISHDGKWMMWTSQRTTDGQSQVFLADFKKPQ